MIDWKELREVLENCGADPPVEKWEVDELFQEADRNGDGVIDIEGYLLKSVSLLLNRFAIDPGLAKCDSIF